MPSLAEHKEVRVSVGGGTGTGAFGKASVKLNLASSLLGMGMGMVSPQAPESNTKESESNREAGATDLKEAAEPEIVAQARRSVTNMSAAAQQMVNAVAGSGAIDGARKEVQREMLSAAQRQLDELQQQQNGHGNGSDHAVTAGSRGNGDGDAEPEGRGREQRQPSQRQSRTKKEQRVSVNQRRPSLLTGVNSAALARIICTKP